MENAINATKDMILRQVEDNKCSFIGEPFTQYQKVYFSTNENIKGYINSKNLNNGENALTVLSSGDHVFNLVRENVLNIDAFDTNTLTEFYVFGIRIPMILKYDYRDYLEILNKIISEEITLDEMTTFFNDLLPYMDKKYRTYWNIIKEYNYKMQKEHNTNINLFNLITLGNYNFKKFILRNNYLEDDVSYEILRNNLKRVNIRFKNIDVLDISKNYNDKYDIILLSNIFDYMFKHFGYNYNYSDIKEYLNNLRNMLKENGSIFFKYIYNYSSKYTIRKKLFPNSKINIDDLLPGRVSDFKLNDDINDGMIILKKK